MEKGTVYFFTGLSGAGKTTIGGLFYRRLKARKPNVVLLDGDQIRPVFAEDIGYSGDDRIRGARRIRVAKMLSSIMAISFRSSTVRTACPILSISSVRPAPSLETNKYQGCRLFDDPDGKLLLRL